MRFYLTLALFISGFIAIHMFLWEVYRSINDLERADYFMLGIVALLLASLVNGVGHGAAEKRRRDGKDHQNQPAVSE